MAAIALSCKGCRKTAKVDIDYPLQAYELVRWIRDVDGDWCVICQEQRTGESQLQRAVRAKANVVRENNPRAPRRELELQPSEGLEVRALVVFVLLWMALSALLAAGVLFLLSVFGVR